MSFTEPPAELQIESSQIESSAEAEFNQALSDLVFHLKELRNIPRVKGVPRLKGLPSDAKADNSMQEHRPNPDSDPRDSFDWKQLEQEALSCRRCRLCEERNNVVFGAGCRDNPALVFVGEGPGAEEDRLGEPFVGRAGELLTAAITKGMCLKREDVYICNVVKCRPPNNRTPLPDETTACSPFLFRQLELLKPKVIVTLGQPAQRALVGLEAGITKIRGTWQDWRGIKLMPTFHPAYLLRNPAAKRLFWEDLKAVMSELGLEGK